MIQLRGQFRSGTKGMTSMVCFYGIQTDPIYVLI